MRSPLPGRARLSAPLAAAFCTALALPLAACSGGSGAEGSNTIKVAYERSMDNNNRVMDNYLAQVKSQFEKANPGKKVELLPIQAAENDYYTKVELMMRSPRTAPDLVYEDTSLINSDIKSGYLAPLDSRLAQWPEWGQWLPAAKAAAKAQDGHTYGVPDGTDTRGIFYNKQIFRSAGLPVPWQPKSWADILSAARAIKARVPGVTPMNIYTGKAPGEVAVMQGFEMLLYGTPGATPLFDPAGQKWVTGSQGFRDALKFVQTVYGEKLGLPVQTALDPNIQSTIATEYLPSGKLGLSIDGSWTGSNWLSTGSKPWPQWSSALGEAAMPTENGQAPGKTTMSGGWTWAITAKAHNPDLAWKFITTLQTEKNAVAYDVDAAQVAVRKDVAADPTYLKSTPDTAFWTGLVQYTHYRPGQPVYPQISTAIGEAMESVSTGQASVDQAAKTYDQAVASATGGAVENLPQQGAGG